MPPRRIKNEDINNPIYNKIKDGNTKRNKKVSRESDIFNNPMIDKARRTIPKEQQTNWEKIGKEMYNSVDFVDADGKSQTLPESMVEGAAYIVESITSGMHIYYLEENEIDLLAEIYGNKWFERFGYTEKDLSEIHTFPEQSILSSLKQ